MSELEEAWADRPTCSVDGCERPAVAKMVTPLVTEAYRCLVDLEYDLDRDFFRDDPAFERDLAPGDGIRSDGGFPEPDRVSVECPHCGHRFETHDVGDRAGCEECGEFFSRFSNIVGGTDAASTDTDRGQIPVHWYPLLFAALLLALAVLAATVEVAP